MEFRTVLIGALTAWVLMSGTGWGQAVPVVNSPPDGLQIMKNSLTLHQAQDQLSTVTLLLEDKRGQQRKLVTRRFWKNFAGRDGFDSKLLFRTEYPPDNRGTGFLIWDYAIEGKSDDLWLYLPSLRQSRRMTTRDQDDAFMGSDLTFSDMGQRRLDEDTHTMIGSGTHQGTPCYLVGSAPVNQGGVYSKRISCIAKEDWLTLRIDYYDTKGDLLKTHTIDWEKEGNYQIYRKMYVRNVQTGHSTTFLISDISVDNHLRDNQFTERALRRGGSR